MVAFAERQASHILQKKMPSGTYTQLYIHIIFAVKGRESLIRQEWEENLYKYITGVVQNKGHKMIAINGVQDHIHILIGQNAIESLSELVREVKKVSSVFIKEKGYSKRFYWQSGYGAFSCSRSSLDQVIAYIDRQKEHHSTKSFREEYRAFLERYGIDYDERYLFEEVRNS